jgi:molybdopterin-guanine dinucleotide biosynthesis protein A
MRPRPHCTGAIIAGGRATRFGGIAKGLERVGGVRMIDRAADTLRESCDELLLVANDDAAPTWISGIRIVKDIRPDCGALGGIHSALVNSPEAVMVLAWDTPFVPGALMSALRDEGNRDGIDAVVAASNSKWGFEPLCAWYSRSCLARIEHSLNTGDRRTGQWLPTVNASRLDVSPWGDPSEIFFNVNSSEDLAIANSKFSA